MPARKSPVSRPAAKKKRASPLEARLAALPAAAADTSPVVPVSITVLEARQAALAALKDRNLFLKLHGFDIRDLDDLQPLAGALEVAEDHWKELRLSKKGGAPGASRKDAEALRRDLLSAGRYLFRKDPAVVALLDDIAAGEGLPDLVDDLRRLADFVDEHGKQFESAPRIPPDPGAVARSLRSALTAGADSEEATAAHAHRNQVAQALQGALDEVRAAAKFLFRDDPKKLVKITSHYQVAKQRKSRGAPSPTPAPAPNP